MSKFIVLMVYMLYAEGGSTPHNLTIPTPPYVKTRAQCFDYAEKVARHYEATQAGILVVKKQQCLEVK